MKNNNKDVMLLIFASLVWGLTFPLMKRALNFVDEIPFLAMRFSIGFLVLLVYSYKNIKFIDKKTIKYGAILGVMLFFAMFCQTAGLRYTSATNSAFISSIYIVFVPLYVAILHNVKLKKSNIASVLVVTLGLAMVCGVLVLQGNFPFVHISLTQINMGDFITFLGMFAFGAYILASNRFAKACDPVLLTLTNIGGIALLSLIACLFVKDPNIDLSNGGTVINIIFLGVFSSAVCYLITIKVQKKLTPLHVSVILSSEPMFGGIFAAIVPDIYGNVERMTGGGLVGCFMIMGGILITEIHDEINRRKVGL